MLLIADFRDTSGKKFIQIKRHEFYSIVDYKSGKIIDNIKGGRLINESASDSSKYANVTHDYSKFYVRNNIGLYDFRAYDYKYVNINTESLQVDASNFDEVVISVFKCANEFYFRVDKWIWKLNISVGTHTLADDRIFVLDIGVNRLKWLGSQAYAYTIYIMLCVDCIIYNKSKNVITYRISSRPFTRRFNSFDKFGDFLSSYINTIDLDTGVMYRVSDGSNYQGIDLDKFNRNLVFGGV